MGSRYCVLRVPKDLSLRSSIGSDCLIAAFVWLRLRAVTHMIQLPQPIDKCQLGDRAASFMRPSCHKEQSSRAFAMVWCSLMSMARKRATSI